MINLRDKKIIKYSIRTIVIVVLSFVFLSLILNIKPFYNIYKTSFEFNKNIKIAQNQISDKDFNNLINTVKELNKESLILSTNIDKLKIINKIPVLSENIKSTKELSDIVYLGTDSFIKVYPVIEKNYFVFAGSKNINIMSMPDKQKNQVIAGIYEIRDSIDSVQLNVGKILDIINKHKDNNLIKPLKDVWVKIYNYKSNIQDINNSLPLIKTLPDLLGIPSKSKYLFLFQNNTELRPTGGFIGTYGTVEIYNAEISKVFTDNIYNLDRSAESRITTKAPKPIKDYLNLDKLYLRDANWNPDFEESAKNLSYLYKKESQNQYPISGVIAITPSVIQDVIGYFGEIEVMSSKFNKDNTVDLLNYETKFGYWENRGISESQRKIIIQKLSDALFEKIKNLSFSQIKDLSYILSNSLNNKQMLLYFANDKAQQFVIDNNWGGKMTGEDNSDYFAVVDANLASGKSDPYIDRSIDYDLRYVDNKLVSTLSLTYKHRYDDYVKNQIYQDDLGYVQFYKTYTRIYVPKGSRLKSLQINDGDYINIKNVDSGNENGKTFFGFYFTIPKNETYTYKFEYTLPDDLKDDFKEKYSLTYQKQAGLYYNKINANINLSRPISSYKSSDNKGLSFNSYNQKLNFNGLVSNDKKIDIYFYSNSDIGYLQKIIKKNYLSFKKEAPLGN